MVAPDLYDDKPLSADMSPEQRQERMGQASGGGILPDDDCDRMT